MKQEGDKTRKSVICSVREKKNVRSALLLEVSRIGIGTVLRLEKYAWSMVKCLQ